MVTALWHKWCGWNMSGAGTRMVSWWQYGSLTISGVKSEFLMVYLTLQFVHLFIKISIVPLPLESWDYIFLFRNICLHSTWFSTSTYHSLHFGRIIFKTQFILSQCHEIRHCQTTSATSFLPLTYCLLSFLV